MARRGVRLEARDIDKGWRRVVALAKEIERESPYVKVGLIGSEADKTPAGGDLTQAEIGTIQEYGSSDGRIPARSWIGRTFDEKREALLHDAKKLIGLVYDGKMTTTRTLGILGARFSADIKNRVTVGDEIPPPNAPSTAARKEAKTRTGASHGIRTLIDTGRMIASVTWAVISGKITK